MAETEGPEENDEDEEGEASFAGAESEIATSIIPEISQKELDRHGATNAGQIAWLKRQISGYQDKCGKAQQELERSLRELAGDKQLMGELQESNSSLKWSSGIVALVATVGGVAVNFEGWKPIGSAGVIVAAVIQFAFANKDFFTRKSAK